MNKLKKDVIQLFNDLFNNNIHSINFTSNSLAGFSFDLIEVKSYNINKACKITKIGNTPTAIEVASRRSIIEYESINIYAIANNSIIKKQNEGYLDTVNNKIILKTLGVVNWELS